MKARESSSGYPGAPRGSAVLKAIEEAELKGA